MTEEPETPNDSEEHTAAYWRQRYEEEKAHARLWENRSKANRHAKAKLKRIRLIINEKPQYTESDVNEIVRKRVNRIMRKDTTHE